MKATIWIDNEGFEWTKHCSMCGHRHEILSEYSARDLGMCKKYGDTNNTTYREHLNAGSKGNTCPDFWTTEAIG